VNLGAGLKLLEMGRIGVQVNGGISLIGLFDLDTSDMAGMLYGAFAGGMLTYEFNPSLGIYGSAGYSMYFSEDGLSGLSIQLGVYF